ncbi:unnamed protein product [Ixodes pacificus]
MAVPHSYGRCCSARWCNNSTKNSEFRQFRFPTDDRAVKWITYANRPEFKALSMSKLHERRLCSAHFRDTAFASHRRIHLRPNACLSVQVTDPRLQELVPPEFFMGGCDSPASPSSGGGAGGAPPCSSVLTTANCRLSAGGGAGGAPP